jgi:Tfp pilus assembly protein PilV
VAIQMTALTQTNASFASEDGFSFAEVMLTTMILGFILAAAWLVMSTVSTVSDGIIARGQAQTQGQLAIEKMTRDIRMAQQLPDRSATADEHRFMDYTVSTCTFFGDINHDGTLEEIKYNDTGGHITRSVAVATVTTPHIPYNDQFGAFSTPQNIASISPTDTTIFTYLDNTGAIAGSQVSICAVKVDLSTVAKSGATSVTVDFPTATIAVRAF